VNKDRIRCRWNGTRTSKSTRNPSNLKLDTHQDKALCWYLTRLWEIGVPLRYKGIDAAANEILAIAHNPALESKPPTVGENWAR
jgi:hypothetical protein